MAGSEAPSHFTVHVFLNHHPVVARALLPDLFIDFPDLAWKLEPLEKQPPRPREKPPRSSVHHWVERRDQLGRYVFREPVAGDTTLLQLSEKMEREFDIAKRYQAQFTIFPQYFDEDGQYPQWHNRPMPWNMTLADIHPLDEDAGYRAAAGHALQTPIGNAPVIHLVLETKAAALTRILDTDFLGAHLGDAYKYFRDQWNRLDSYWHASLSGEDWPQLRSLLASWRVARAAHAYLTQQRAKGRLGAENEELKEHRQRVEEIRALKKQGDLSLLKERIRRLESNERNGREELGKMSWLVTQWEDWFVNRDFENFETRNLGPDDVKEKVVSVMRHSYRIVDGWISSERRQTLKVSLEEEYYANRPWLTEEDRAKSEEWRVEELKRRTQIVRKAVTEDLTALTGDYLVPSQTIETHKFRGPDKKLLPDRASFTVTSGSLLWGQMIPLYTTLSNPNFTQNADHMPPALEGGTILQHRYSYRSAARNGRWKVRPFYERVRLSDAGNFLADPDAEELLGGWIVHHEDSDPMQILDRVRWTDGTGPGAVSNGNTHTDKDVVYIGRYDWSFHAFRENVNSKFQEWAEPVIGPIPQPRDEYDDATCNVEKNGYFIVIDETQFGLDLVEAYKRDCDRGYRSWADERHMEPNLERVFRKDGVNFGTFLSMAHSAEDYGWLVFSGEQHADHGVDELVGIVYSNWRIENMFLTLEANS